MPPCAPLHADNGRVGRSSANFEPHKHPAEQRARGKVRERGREARRIVGFSQVQPVVSDLQRLCVLSAFAEVASPALLLLLC